MFKQFKSLSRFKLTSLTALAFAGPVACLSSFSTTTSHTMSDSTFHQFHAKDIHGNDFDFSQLAGRVVFITNVASK